VLSVVVEERVQGGVVSVVVADREREQGEVSAECGCVRESAGWSGECGCGREREHRVECVLSVVVIERERERAWWSEC